MPVETKNKPFYVAWLIFGAAVALTIFALSNREFETLAGWSLAVEIYLFLVWLFLRPQRSWAIELAQTGRPLKTSVFLAAGMAMALTVGAVLMAMDVLGLFEPGGALRDMDEDTGWPLFWLLVGSAWFFWGAMFFAYWRLGDRYTQLRRMAHRLMAGSLLQLLVAILMLVRHRKHECICATGSFASLVLSSTVLLWTFGPGIVLLSMRRSYRKQNRTGFCRQCEYDLTGTLIAGGTTCPECGNAIPPGTPVPKV